jgi:HCOMODA/2-hydroxy-3-carboxy-muconic semialdehyde decarboxylase
MRKIQVIAAMAALTLAASASQAAPDPDEERVSELVIANRILVDQGVLDGFGHVTVRSAKNPSHYFMAVSRAAGLVTRADIVEFDADGKPVKPESRELYSERFIHGEVFRARPDVQAVVHAHTPAILPYGLTKTPLKAVIHVAYFLGTEPAPVFDIRDAEGEKNEMLVRNPQTGAALAKVLGPRSVVLMRGHGMTVAGPTLRDAVFRAIYTKVNAEVESEALRLGPPVFMNQFEVGRTERITRQWEAWVARVRPGLEGR